MSLIYSCCVPDVICVYIYIVVQNWVKVYVPYILTQCYIKLKSISLYSNSFNTYSILEFLYIQSAFSLLTWNSPISESYFWPNLWKLQQFWHCLSIWVNMPRESRRYHLTILKRTSFSGLRSYLPLLHIGVNKLSAGPRLSPCRELLLMKLIRQKRNFF
jgi:hypothetical protein